MVINSCSINEKKFCFFKCRGSSIDCFCKALCPDGTLSLAVCLPGSGLTPVSVICLLSLGEGNTIIRGGICSWNGLGAHLVGSRARLSRAQWDRLGVIMVCGFPVECSGMSCLAALVLGYIASSKALKIAPVGEESDTQLHIELVRIYLNLVVPGSMSPGSQPPMQQLAEGLLPSWLHFCARHSRASPKGPSSIASSV